MGTAPAPPQANPRQSAPFRRQRVREPGRRFGAGPPDSRFNAFVAKTGTDHRETRLPEAEKVFIRNSLCSLTKEGRVNRTASVIATCAAFVVLFAAIVARAAADAAWPPYSPDSWAYVDLAKTLFSDFYRIGHARSWLTGSYSAAFPPLWPLVIALGQLAGLGPLCGLTIGWALVAASVALLALAGRRAGAGVGPALVTGALLVWHPAFAEEVSAGRSLSLTIFLVAALAVSLTSTRPAWRAASAGMLLGLMVMTRFDSLLWAVPIAALMGWRDGPRLLGLAFLTWLAALSPWILYSMVQFGTVFATDNSWVATSAVAGTFVTDYPPRAAQTLWTAPLQWASLKLSGLPALKDALWQSPGPMGRALIGIALLVGLAALIRRGNGPPLVARWPLLGLGLAPVMSLPAYLATGYTDERYFAPLAASLVFGGLVVSVGRGRGNQLLSILATAATAWALIVTVPQIGRPAPADPLDRDRAMVLAHCLSTEPQPVLVIMDDAIAAARFSALYGIRTGFLPANFAREDVGATLRAAFIADKHPTHFLDLNGIAPDVFADASIAMDCPLPLKRIALAR